MKTCGVGNCQRKSYARGYCRMHYKRWRKHGDPTVVLKNRPPAARVHPEERYGRLVVLREAGRTAGDKRKFACRCDCGAIVVVTGAHLQRGGTRSCGCLRRKRTTERNLKHGHKYRGAQSLTYSSWMSLRGRCLDPSNPSWDWYGARGITVCDRWLHSFENFLADMGERPTGKSIDRIDVDGNYEPGNCRWATRRQQAANKRPRAKVAV